MTHAYFKAMLFLCSGAVIHGLSDQQDMRYMGGLRKHMPAVAYTYLIGTLAISGIFLSGFWSKEEIFAGLESGNKIILLILAVVIAGMTSFYMFRTYFMTFEGEYRGHSHPHNSTKVITIPLIILAVPSAVIGFILSGKLEFLGIGSFDGFINFASHKCHCLEHHEDLLIPVISVIVALAGLIIAAAMYHDGFKKFFALNPDTFRQKLSTLYALSFNKWYIDDFYYGFIRKIFLPVSRLLAGFDIFIVDGIVNLCALKTACKGYILRLFQNGNVQTYAAVLFGGLMFITVSLLAFWLFLQGV
jgi:NADH:ubiquinone oxidoreductase subunit 5 (subunit L)/multisubunit Na+/H+ antiporter MnhA subunit